MPSPSPSERAGGEIDAVSRDIAILLAPISGAGDELLSLPWLCTLLDAFSTSLDGFSAAIAARRQRGDRAYVDFLDSAVLALDVCNAARDGVAQLRQWLAIAGIVTSVLADGDGAASGGSLQRAKKAAHDLLAFMPESRDREASSHRTRSFGRRTDAPPAIPQLRSRSWSAPRSISLSKQVQSMASNLAPPRAGNGGPLSASAYAMSCLLAVTMHVLLTAMPCQDCNRRAPPPLQLTLPKAGSWNPWATALALVYESVVEEARRRRLSSGLLREVLEMEKLVNRTVELLDVAESPSWSEEKASELRGAARELANVSGSTRRGVDALERRVRDVFGRIVRARIDSFGAA